MIIDYFDLIKQVFQNFSSINSRFGSIQGRMSDVMSNVTSANVIGSLDKYFGTIKYVAGDKVFNTLVYTLQVGFFILLAKTLYELIQAILVQFKMQSPLSIIKTFLKL